MGLRDNLYSNQGGRCRVCMDDFPNQLLTVTYLASLSDAHPNAGPELVMLCHSCADELGGHSPPERRESGRFRRRMFTS